MKSSTKDPPGVYQQNSHYQNTYSTEKDYRSELSPGFSNISELNTYPHQNYISDYNTVYVNAEYRPLSAFELNENQPNAQERVEQQNADLSRKYMELNPSGYLEDDQANQKHQPNPNQYQQNSYNLYEPTVPIHKPPPYSEDELMFPSARSNDYVINTPYPTPDQKNKPSKSIVARCCGQLFSVFLVVFMLLLSFLLIQSFRANLTASYIQKHNQNEWRSKGD